MTDENRTDANDSANQGAKNGKPAAPPASGQEEQAASDQRSGVADEDPLSAHPS